MILVSEGPGFPQTLCVRRRHLRKWENARKSCPTAVNRFLCSLVKTGLVVTFQRRLCMTHDCLSHSSSAIEVKQCRPTLCWLCTERIESIHASGRVVVMIFVALWVSVDFTYFHTRHVPFVKHTQANNPASFPVMHNSHTANSEAE